MPALKSKQQEQACQELVLNNLSQSDAYRAAYPRSKKWKPETVHAEASKLFASPKVRTRLDELRSEMAKVAEDKFQVDAEAVMRQLVRMGFSDVRGLFTEAGHLRPIHELSDDMAAAVSSIEVVTRTLPTPKGEPAEVEYVHKVKLEGRVKPIELIGKHFGKKLGEWAEKLEHAGKDGGPIEHIHKDMPPDEASRTYKEMLKGG